MPAVTATPGHIIAAIEKFPDYIQRQFLIDRMDMYLGHGMMPDGNGGFRIMHMDNPAEAEELLNFKLEMLRKCRSFSTIFLMVNKPDRLQLLKILTGGYDFGKEDYAELLRDAWVATEFPHQMAVKDLIWMFGNADRKFLMSGDEIKALDEMPDEFEIYRGYSVKEVKEKRTKRRGLSWTLDKKTAVWFAKRWARNDGRFTTATVRKMDVYAYIKSRGEEEIVVNPYKLKNVQEVGV